MTLCSITKAFRGITLCIAALSGAAGLLRAELYPSAPIGRLATSGKVSVGKALAPTGTTIFAGDRLLAENAPALIHFMSGSSVALTSGAAAAFSRDGDTIVMRIDSGSVSFHFVAGERARIEAGPYRFNSSQQSRPHSGEAAVESGGRVTLSLSSGNFWAVDTNSGRRFEVSALPQGTPPVQSTGKGTLVNDGDTLTDAAQRWPENSLRNKCIVARGEAHRILANNANTLRIVGTWILFSGTYEYVITDCTEQSLQNAGAAIGIKEALEPVQAAAAIPARVASPGMSGAAKAGIAVAAAGGAGAAIAVASSRKSKSP